ncbi:MAG: hypothetical protein JW857_00420 [Bacteroidales bacterium]|nr:hypothetical protein [Bacteroidales bacterium]
MPNEIKIVLPDATSEEHFDIQIQHSGGKNLPLYRFEIWDLENDNPSGLSTAEFLRKKIKTIENKWQVAEIYSETQRRIPILLKQKQSI